MDELFVRSFDILYFIVRSRQDLVEVDYMHMPHSIQSLRNIGDKHRIDQ